jgi:sialic acid synthase SpsE
VFLGCTVAYPCDLSAVDLRSMPRGDHLWGLSDHTTHPTIAPCAAVALGACVVEKHIRGSRGVWDTEVKPPTPDWDHSLPPNQFGFMVSAIRMTEQALGSSEKRIRKSEEPYLKYRRGPRGLRGS